MRKILQNLCLLSVCKVSPYSRSKLHQSTFFYKYFYMKLVMGLIQYALRDGYLNIFNGICKKIITHLLNISSTSPFKDGVYLFADHFPTSLLFSEASVCDCPACR